MGQSLSKDFDDALDSSGGILHPGHDIIDNGSQYHGRRNRASKAFPRLQGRRMAFFHNSTMFGCISADGLSLTAEVRVSDGSPSGVSYRHDWQISSRRVGLARMTSAKRRNDNAPRRSAMTA
jgi:hypothetical protein